MNIRWLWTLVCTCMLFLSAVPVAQATTDDGEPWPTPTCNADRQNWTMGLIYCNHEASLGYTLFSPIPSNTTYLIDHEGRELHQWSSPGEHRPALSAYLLPDGDLLRTANIAQTAVGNFSGGGTGGKVERISWDGTLEWSWEYSSTLHISHHDIEPMPNGNLLMIAWDERSEEEALQAGRNPAIASDSPGGENNVWPDHIIEVKPVGSDDAEIVWRWYAWDHLIQDYDETKDNYGVVADHPELLNINYVGATGNQAGRADWMHCNGLDYNSALDQIALSCRGMNEVYIIDHSTTTEEAAGHTGGNAGKGGDILYRWGNPQVYHKGLSSDQQFFAQHDVQWIEAGHPDEGGLIVFNNGVGRYPAYSSVDILHPPMNNGTYVLEANGTFGPNLPSWTWDQGEAMYSDAISGAQALANGNILVTHGTQGTLYEVNRDGDVVWEYIGPVGPDGSYVQGEALPEGNRAGTTANAIFKATHYPVDHPAFTNRTLLGVDYIEHWNDSCPEEEAWGWDKNGDVVSTTATTTASPTPTIVVIWAMTRWTRTTTASSTPAMHWWTVTAMVWRTAWICVKATTTQWTRTTTACPNLVIHWLIAITTPSQIAPTSVRDTTTSLMRITTRCPTVVTHSLTRTVTVLPTAKTSAQQAMTKLTLTWTAYPMRAMILHNRLRTPPSWKKTKRGHRRAQPTRLTTKHRCSPATRLRFCWWGAWCWWDSCGRTIGLPSAEFSCPRNPILPLTRS